MKIVSSYPLESLSDTSFAIWGWRSLGQIANKAKYCISCFLPCPLMFLLHTNFISLSSFCASNSHAVGRDVPLIVYVPKLSIFYLKRLLHFSPKWINYCWKFQEPWNVVKGRGKAGNWGTKDVSQYSLNLLNYVVSEAILSI